MSPLVDSHCHLPLLAAARDGLAPQVAVARAREAGVHWMLCVAVDLDSFGEVRGCARDLDGVFASVGVHPCTVAAREPDAGELARLADCEEVIAIGETGLDHYHETTSPALQEARFRTHVQAARAAGKPLVIHSREAPGEVLRVLREERAAEVGGVMHCFVDDWDTARAAMDLGFRISLSGIVTFKNARRLQDVARRLPADMLLVETDCPYLAPVPFRGKTNQPAFVRHTAEFVAELRGEDLDGLAGRTTENFFTLFAQAREKAS